MFIAITEIVGSILGILAVVAGLTLAISQISAAFKTMRDKERP